MTALTDPRPHVFMELPIDPGAEHREGVSYAVLVGRLVGQMLDTWPDIDLPTVRIWQHQADGTPTLRIDARRGQLAGIDCPQCHQPAGRPHTEYCPLALREEIFAGQADLGQTTPLPDEPWVDNGCRCPNPELHLAGCPVTEPTDERCGWDTDHQPHDWEDEAHKHHCDCG